MKRLQILFAVLLIVALVGGVAFAQSGYDLFQKALAKERAEGKLEEAIQLYKQIVREHASDRTLAAKALVQMGRCYEKLGNVEAQKAYERVVREYADQPEVTEARVRLAALTKPASSTTGVVVRQVWTGLGDATAISRDGRFLAYLGFDSALYVRDLVTGDDRRITNLAGDYERVWSPTFSPDGKLVAYVRSLGGRLELRLISLDGSAGRVLYHSDEVVGLGTFDWSPDGKQILTGFSKEGGINQIVLVSVADGSVRVLKTFGYLRIGTPRFSPGGRYIAYDLATKEESPERDIFLFDTDGDREFPLVTQAADDFRPVWTPDGSGLLFLSARAGSTGAWFLRVVDGKPQGSPELVKRDMGHNVPIGFTQNGSLYYKEWSDMAELYTVSLDPTSGTITGQPATVTERLVTQNGEAWSPNGQYLAYSSRRSSFQGEARIIVIRSVQTGEEYELAPALHRFDLQDWSPDSRSLLVTARDKDGRGGAYRVDARTGDVALLAMTGFAFDTANWFANGKSIVFGRSDSPVGGQIVERDLETGHETEWYRAPASLKLYYVEASADGRHLAFILRDREMKVAGASLMVMTAAGEKPHKLDLRLKGSDEVDSILGFTPDSRQVLFNSFDPGQLERGYKYWRISVDGGADPQEIRLNLDRPVYTEQMSFHPDGQRIAFTAVSLHSSSKSAVWVMENFLPASKAAK